MGVLLCSKLTNTVSSVIIVSKMLIQRLQEAILTRDNGGKQEFGIN